jgi:hypothetical protein
MQMKRSLNVGGNMRLHLPAYPSRMKQSLLFVLLFLVYPTMAIAQDKPVVLSDQLLVTWSHDTFERGDYIYAAIHIGALIQRNPPILRSHPIETQQLYDAWVFSVAQLQSYKSSAELLPGVKTQLAECEHPGSRVSGITYTPERPKVNWPILKP